jgi:hypothetical protein
MPTSLILRADEANRMRKRMSAYGTERKSRDARYSSAYEVEVDMPNIPSDFR